MGIRVQPARLDGPWRTARRLVTGAAALAADPTPADTAAASTLSVSPAPDGAVQLRPSWNGFAGISSWEVVGGAAPTSLSPVTIPISEGKPPRRRSMFRGARDAKGISD